MNRLLFCALPCLSLGQANDADGVVLLQKHASKTSLKQVPEENVPPVPGYTNKPNVHIGGGTCMPLGMIVGQTVQDCADDCDKNPTCGGWAMSQFSLAGMPGPGGRPMPITYACYFACVDGSEVSDATMYSYVKTDKTTTTTTSSTLYIYTTDPGIGDCTPAWNVKKLTWCCENNPNFEGRAELCKDFPVPGAVDDPHITSVTGDKFDVYKPGEHEFLVIPEGASPQTADLHISGKVRKHGARENDLWIRQLKVQGKWVQAGPYEFKTSNADFGKKKSALIRVGTSPEWKVIDSTNLDSNLHLVSAVDEKAPETDFAQSVSKSLTLKAGPVEVLIDWATSQKDGDDVNHMDLHMKGLHSSHVKSMGGLLAGNVAALQMK